MNTMQGACSLAAAETKQRNKHKLYPFGQKLETLNMTLMEIGVH